MNITVRVNFSRC